MIQYVVPFSRIFDDPSIPPEAVLKMKAEASFNVSSTGLLGNCGVGTISNTYVRHAVVDYGHGALKQARPDLFEGFGLKAAAAQVQTAFIQGINDCPMHLDPFYPWATFTKELMQRLNGYQMYVLTDGINKRSEVRGMGGFAQRYTADTARALFESGFGVTMQSPVAVNKLHQGSTDFGLVQVWVWMPPDAQAFLPMTKLISGELPTTAEEAADRYMQTPYYTKNPNYWKGFGKPELTNAFNTWNYQHPLRNVAIEAKADIKTVKEKTTEVAKVATEAVPKFVDEPAGAYWIKQYDQMMAQMVPPPPAAKPKRPRRPSAPQYGQIDKAITKKAIAKGKQI
jgi:hypothetical protein